MNMNIIKNAGEMLVEYQKNSSNFYEYKSGFNYFSARNRNDSCSNNSIYRNKNLKNCYSKELDDKHNGNSYSNNSILQNNNLKTIENERVNNRYDGSEDRYRTIYKNSKSIDRTILQNNILDNIINPPMPNIEPIPSPNIINI